MPPNKNNIANAVAGKTARPCDNCLRNRARWYCAADDAFLCQPCDSSVHSANSLASRHHRLRLNSASSPAPSWHRGFTTKPRTPRHVARRPKPNAVFSLVPEAEETTSREENEDDQLLYRVPVFDPFVADEEVPKAVDSESFHGFLPSEMDLAEFAADVESLLGRNLENECFDMERLGLMDCKAKEDAAPAQGRVKIEEEEEACGVQQFDGEVDLIREPFVLNFEDYDDAPGSCHEEDDTAAAMAAKVVGVKNEGDETKMTKSKRKLVLRLDCDAVIAAWGGERSPWTTGDRPDLDADECWPDCVAAINGANYGHPGGDLGRRAAVGDGGREARVSRYREKRLTRLFSKKIRYEVRKLNAEKRPRMKGRFVKRTGTPFAPPSLPIISIK